MKVNQAQAKLIKEALHHWTTQGKIDSSLEKELSESLDIQKFNWKKLAKYSFWIAILCITISIVSILADDILMEMIKAFFNAPALIRCILLSLLAAIFYSLGIRRKIKFPNKVFSNEAILFLGVLVTATAIHQLGEAISNNSGHFSILLLISFVIYAILGFLFKSNLIWLFALLSLGSWMGTETGYMSGWGAYYLGMNFPLRFVLFGSLLTAIALYLESKNWFHQLFKTTLVMGLLYLFIALWLMSIFGNYGDIHSWSQVKQFELFHWSFLFGFIALLSIFHGLKFENGITKGFGLTFLFINLYTRFFEYFWDATHKAIFFSILAISFWLIGSKAEKIWNIGNKNHLN